MISRIVYSEGPMFPSSIFYKLDRTECLKCFQIRYSNNNFIDAGQLRPLGLLLRRINISPNFNYKIHNIQTVH